MGRSTKLGVAACLVAWMGLEAHAQGAPAATELTQRATPQFLLPRLRVTGNTEGTSRFEAGADFALTPGTWTFLLEPSLGVKTEKGLGTLLSVKDTEDGPKATPALETTVRFSTFHFAARGDKDKDEALGRKAFNICLDRCGGYGLAEDEKKFCDQANLLLASDALAMKACGSPPAVWMDKAPQQGRRLGRFARWLSRSAAATIRLDTLAWFLGLLQVDETRSVYRDEDAEGGVAELLNVVWDQDQNRLRSALKSFDAFRGLLAWLIERQNTLGLELQGRIAGLA